MPVSEWLPRVPLALLACARALLVPGQHSVCCEELLNWPIVRWTIRWRAPEPASLRAPVQ